MELCFTINILVEIRCSFGESLNEIGDFGDMPEISFSEVEMLWRVFEFGGLRVERASGFIQESDEFGVGEECFAHGMRGNLRGLHDDSLDKRVQHIVPFVLQEELKQHLMQIILRDLLHDEEVLQFQQHAEQLDDLQSSLPERVDRLPIGRLQRVVAFLLRSEFLDEPAYRLT